MKSIFSLLKNKISSWFDARIKPNQTLELKQSNIYILPTRYGWLLLAIIILILIAATNYQNNMGFMAGFILLAIGILSVFYTYRNLNHLKLSFAKPKAVFVGELIDFPVTFNNPTEQYRASIGVGNSKNKMDFFDIDTNSHSQLKVTFLAEKRGVHSAGRMACISYFPFGIFQVWSYFKTPYSALVYPKPIAPNFNLSGENNDGDSLSSAVQKGHEDFYGVKEYQAGDPIKQVMWKAYARERGLLTKEFEEHVGQQMWFSWESVKHLETELALSNLCYVLLEAEKGNAEYGLEMPQEKTALSKGQKHLNSCLEMLARF